jgi:homoserine kinase
MNAARKSVAVRVPASTSNCGAGFDTLGLALNLYNRVTLRRIPGDSVQAERPADAPALEMVRDAARRFAESAGSPAAGFAYRIDGEVPPARGLGSSVTIIAGVLAGLDALHGTGWPRRRLVALATDAEGHPDNASAGVLGGFCVSRCDPQTGAYRDTVRFEVPPELVFAVVSPEIELLTRESRGALPASLPFFDAVKSVNSAAYLVAAIASGDYKRLRYAAGDFLHEPYRLPGIPGAKAAIEAGVAAGAYTGWLSGSGSSVLCACAREASGPAAAAMTRAFAEAGLRAESRVLEADNRGLRVEA